MLIAPIKRHRKFKAPPHCGSLFRILPIFAFAFHTFISSAL